MVKESPSVSKEEKTSFTNEENVVLNEESVQPKNKEKKTKAIKKDKDSIEGTTNSS